jgi:hypothetical protein
MKMKIDISKRAVSAALAFMFVAAAIPSANAQQTDLRTFVVGTWRQGVYETHLFANGSYKKYLFVNGNFADPAWTAGTWEIRNGNELWFHITAWYPIWQRGCPDSARVDNYCSHDKQGRIQIQDSEMVPIQIIDANHTRNVGGIATRIGR